MDRLRCIQTFVEVARDGSFTGAARRLGISKASVTKHVASLEHSLRARLLHRTTKQVGLTEAGVSTLRSGKLLLERYEEIEADVRDSIRGPKGVIRVGTPPSFGTHHLVPLVTAFSALHPDIQIALSLDDGNANLIAQGLDLSVRIAPALEGRDLHRAAADEGSASARGGGGLPAKARRAASAGGSRAA